MGPRACTINVGGGPGGSAARTRAMVAWAREAIDTQHPAVVFAQEVTPAWVDVWVAAGYQVRWDPDSPWRIRSALITAPELTIIDLPDGWWPNAEYHSSYLAAAVWSDSPGGRVTLASVHASPKPADLTTYSWHGDVPSARHGGGDPRWVPDTLWDSDLVAASLIELASHGPLLAAGDFNESTRDDGAGDWGSSFFQRLADRGLHDLTTVDGAEVFATRGGLQLDHVVASVDARDRLGITGFELDPAWQRRDGELLSDHVALWCRFSNLGPMPEN